MKLKFSKMSELLMSVVLVIVAGLFLLDEGLVMPMGGNMLLALFLLVSFLMYAGVIWQENAQDERESVHILIAGRNSFLVGVAILVVGIVKESFSGNIDPWLIMALIGMVGSKVVSRIYSRVRH